MTLATIVIALSSPTTVRAADPFADNNGSVPSSAQYNGTIFKLRHDYPQSISPVATAFPWQQAIGNADISPSNAAAYVNSLKQYVTSDMKMLLTDYSSWNSSKATWYSEPWLGEIREAIHGLYVGSDGFTPDLFDGTGLTKPFTTYVLTFYDARAANTLFKTWGTSAQSPNINISNSQFAEGSVIVKLAFSTANSDDWPVMSGALQWPAFITTNATLGNHPQPQVDKLSFFQFDIIVKDSKSAPRTGWVFSTLVYDKDAPGNSPWEKMVPLGAMWGNDPEVNSTANPTTPLHENWINPNAPRYSKATLGWGGRLSGPNDGAVNAAAFIESGQIKKVDALQSSSCMSCHGASQWTMKSFILPSTKMPPTLIDGSYILMPSPGSDEWMKWFQSRSGTEAQDQGTVPFDYDLVFVFKSLPAWQKANGNRPLTVMTYGRRETELFQYNGLPMPGGAPVSLPFTAK